MHSKPAGKPPAPGPRRPTPLRTKTEEMFGRGHVKIAIAALTWGSIGVIVRRIQAPVPLMVFYRVLFASLTVIGLLAGQGKLSHLRVGARRYRPWLVAIGALLGLNWVAFFYALKLTSIANAVLVTYTAPIFIALMAPIFLHERLEAATVFSLALAVIGLLLIVSPTPIGAGSQDAIGILWGLVSGFTYAVLVLAVKPILREVEAIVILFYESFVAMLVLAPFAVSRLHLGLTAIFLLLLLGTVHTAFANLLYLGGLKTVKTQTAGVLTYLDPLSATLFAAIFLSETPGRATILGGALILLASYNVARHS